jgi:hypothetical protein
MPAKAHKPGPVHRSLRLQHRHHTGRKLAHKHTSYHGLVVVVLLAGLFMAGLNLMAKATADTLRVYGKVSAPIPTEPAVITSPSSGTVSRPSLTVSGTCPVMTPNVIVVLAVDNNEVGSVVCTDGTFSVPIIILPGQHTLVARLYNITDDRGPDSEPVFITYLLPQVGGSSTPHGQGSQNVVAAFNFQQDRPFVVFGPTKPAVWSGTFTGGTLPYHIRVNWGDKKSDSYVLDASGEHTFSHFYREMKPHDITITARDSDGRSQMAHYAAVTPYRSPGTLLGATPRGGSPGAGDLLIMYAVYLMVLIILGLLWKRRQQFTYAPVPVHAQQPRPFQHRYTHAYPLRTTKRTRSHR